MALPPARSATSHTFLIALLFLVLIHSSHSAEVRTIDDTYGDSVSGALPSYSGSWNVGQLSSCSGCSPLSSVNDLADGAFMGSWHDVTTQVDPSDGAPSAVTLSFQGTAIWIYCILVESASPQYAAVFGSNISFELDGNLEEGSFTHAPGTDPMESWGPQPAESDIQFSYAYNQIVFSKTGIDNQNHTLVMTAVRGTRPSLIIFDRAQYTFAEDTSSSAARQSSTETHSIMTSTSTLLKPSQQSTSVARAAEHRVGPIIGGVIGSVVFVIFLACLVAFYRKHQASRQSGEDTVVQYSYSSKKNANKDPTLFTTSVDANRLIHHPSSVTPIVLSTPRDSLPTYTQSPVYDAMRPINVSQQEGDPVLGPPSLRQSVAFSRTEQTRLSSIPYSATSVRLAESTHDADAHAVTSLRYMRAENLEMRRELISLRTEVMRLQIMRTGDMAVAPEDNSSLEPPPAYSSF